MQARRPVAVETYVLLAFVFVFIGFVVGISRANDPAIDILGTVPPDFATPMRLTFVAVVLAFIIGLVINIERINPDTLTRATVVSLCAVGIGAAIGFLLVDIAPFDLLQAILRGLGVTLGLTAMGIILALLVSVLAGIGRLSPFWPLRFITGLYVEVFRGTSILVQMFWIFFVLPLDPFNISISAFEAGVVALGLNIGAYGSEVVRGAIQSVPKGQIEASIALNMSPTRRLVSVVLPQATVRMIPPLGNLAIELLKATSLVSLITLADVTFQGYSAQRTVGRTPEIFLLLLLLYFAMAYPLTLTVRWIERQRRYSF
jgi:polar amino acid transport system permease protein